MNVIEREIDGAWYLAKILNIYTDEKKVTIQYLDGNQKIEEDVDFYEIRSKDEGNSSWKLISLSSITQIFLDDPVERMIDDVWYQASILEVDFSQKLLKLRYSDGNVETRVPFEEIRQMETIKLDSPQDIKVPKLRKYITPENPISLNSILKIIAYFQDRRTYTTTRSLDDENLRYARHHLKKNGFKRRTKSENNILMLLVNAENSSPPKPILYPPSSHQQIFPPPIQYPLIRRNRAPSADPNPLCFLPLAGYCEKCCRLTIYRCKQCGISFFCSRNCQLAEWKASHSNLCTKMHFQPLFTTKGNDVSGAVHTDASIPNVADTRQNDWKSANVMPVRYCASYPDLKVPSDSDKNDWLHSDADTSDIDSGRRPPPPPTYEEAMKQQEEANTDVNLMAPTDIPMSDFKNKRPLQQTVQENNDEPVSADEQAVMNLSEALDRPIEEIRRTLKSMNGDAEKVLEWFLGDNHQTCPVETTPTDSKRPLYFDPLIGLRAGVPSVPEEEPFPFDGNTKDDENSDHDNSEISSITQTHQRISQEQYRKTHPNRTCFLLRENLLSNHSIQSKFPTVIFSGSMSVNGRICYATLTCNSVDGSHLYTLDLVPTDPIVGFVTIDDEPPTKMEIINDEIYTYEHHEKLRISKLRPFTDDGALEAVLDSMIRGRHIYTPSPHEANYSMQTHQFELSQEAILLLLHRAEPDYQRSFQSSIAMLGREIMEKIALGLRTFVVSPQKDFKKYVLLGYHILAKGLHSKQESKYLCQTKKAERVPIFFESHAKGSQIREKLSLKEGWSDPPDLLTGSGSGSELSTGDTKTFTIIPFDEEEEIPKTQYSTSFNPEAVHQLMEMMAIDNETATRALKENSGDLNEAVDWIIQGMPKRFSY